MNAVAVRAAARQREKISHWQGVVNGLAREFNAKSGLFWHRYNATGCEGGGYLEAAGWPDGALEAGMRYARVMPWQFYLLTNPMGTFIDGEQRLGPAYEQGFEKSPLMIEVFQNWMVRYGAVRALGAVLFKDAHPKPRWGIGLALMRPDGERGVGLYSEEEKHRFAAQIPSLIADIQTHPFVIEHKKQDEIGIIRYTLPALPQAFMPERTPEEKALEAQRAQLMEAVKTADAQTLAAILAMMEQAKSPEAAPPQTWQERVAQPEQWSSANAPTEAKKERKSRWKDFVPPTREEVTAAFNTLGRQTRGHTLTEAERREAERVKKYWQRHKADYAPMK